MVAICEYSRLRTKKAISVEENGQYLLCWGRKDWLQCFNLRYGEACVLGYFLEIHTALF